MRILRLSVVAIHLFVVICSSGCKPKGKAVVQSMNQSNRSLSELKKEVWLTGNVSAYEDLSTAYLDYPPEDFLFWAMLMANKYDYSTAYIDVFYSLENAYKASGGPMDAKTKEMSMRYLQIAVDRKVEGAAEALETTYAADSIKSLVN